MFGKFHITFIIREMFGSLKFCLINLEKAIFQIYSEMFKKSKVKSIRNFHFIKYPKMFRKLNLL